MCQKKTWSRRSPDPYTSDKRISLIRPIATALLLLLAGCLPAISVRAETAIQVVSREQSYVFSESLKFVIEAECDSPIIEAILFYGLEGSRLVRRIYPRFASGPQVRIEYTEQLESGQFAPGVKIISWWRLKADDGSVLETEPATFEYADDKQAWRTLSGKQADLFWYGNDETKAKELLGRADEAIDRLQKDIGVSLERRVRIYVYNNERDMSRALSSRSAGYDQMITTLGVSVGENTLLLLGSHRDARLTIAHELSHIVVHLATENPYTDLPSWLDEGLAMYAEGELPRDNQRALEQGIKDDSLLSIRSMTSYSGQASQVDLFYGEAYSVVAFMLKEFGSAKMQELLGVFAEGTLQEEALQRVYGFGLAELDTRWRASLGLGPRQGTSTTATPAVSPSAAPTRTPVESKRNCSYSLGAILFPLLGGVVGLWAKGLRRSA